MCSWTALVSTLSTGPSGSLQVRSRLAALGESLANFADLGACVRVRFAEQGCFMQNMLTTPLYDTLGKRHAAGCCRGAHGIHSRVAHLYALLSCHVLALCRPRCGRAGHPGRRCHGRVCHHGQSRHGAELASYSSRFGAWNLFLCVVGCSLRASPTAVTARTSSTPLSCRCSRLTSRPSSRRYCHSHQSLSLRQCSTLRVWNWCRLQVNSKQLKVLTLADLEKLGASKV
jgi:hypothetical protein